MGGVDTGNITNIRGWRPDVDRPQTTSITYILLWTGGNSVFFIRGWRLFYKKGGRPRFLSPDPGPRTRLKKKKKKKVMRNAHVYRKNKNTREPLRKNKMATTASLLQSQKFTLPDSGHPERVDVVQIDGLVSNTKLRLFCTS